jgi:single-stranded DNA-binding protein
VFEVDVDEVGPSLRYATAQVTRTSGGGQGGGNWQGNQNQGGGQNHGSQGGYGNQPQQGQGSDPWGSSGGGYGGGNRGGNDPWNQAAAEEPPF